MALKLQHYRFVTYNANSQNESFAALFLPKHQLILKFSAYVVLFNQGQTKASHKKTVQEKDLWNERSGAKKSLVMVEAYQSKKGFKRK